MNSFRTGFTCALFTAKRPYDMAKTLARWCNDKSTSIYARLNPEDNTTLTAEALQQKANLTTTARMPVVIDDASALPRSKSDGPPLR